MKCDGCDAKCCRKFIKFITIFDAARIINTLKLEPTHFLDIRPAYNIKSDHPTIMIKGIPYLLALDNKMGRSDCVFLMDIGISKKCGIHSIRPLGCRTYPYALLSDGETLGLSSKFVCPWQYWPDGEERDKYIALFYKQFIEMEEYGKIVDAWNTQHSEDGSFLHFVNFALNKVQQMEHIISIE